MTYDAAGARRVSDEADDPRITAAEMERDFGPDWSQRDLDREADRACDQYERGLG